VAGMASRRPSVTTWPCKFTRKWFEGVAGPPFEGAACQPYESRRRGVTGLTPSMSHSPPQWRGWVPPKELAQQVRGMIPRRMMAPPRRVRALNARTRVWEWALMRGSLERGGARSRGP
jgi:hypothetical protein